MSTSARRLAALVLSGSALCAAGSLQAEDLAGAVTLGYGHLSADGGDADTLGLQGFYDASFGNGLSIAADLGITRTDFGNIAVTTTDIRLKPRYRFGGGVTVGAYYEHLNLAVDGDSLGVTHYGVTLGYATGGFTVEGYVGQTDGGDIGGDKLDDLGLSVVYTSGENLALGGTIARSSADGLDLNALRLGGVFGVTDRWTLFGGAEVADVDGLDVTTIGLGASYGLSSVFGRPASVSLELERIDVSAGGDSADANGVRLGLTIPFGKTATKVPLNSVAHQALRPRHSAVPGLITQGSLF